MREKKFVRRLSLSLLTKKAFVIIYLILAIADKLQLGRLLC